VFEAARNLDGDMSSRGSGVEALFERCSIKKHLMGQARFFLHILCHGRCNLVSGVLFLAV
jgi:hypothetical protein